MVVDNYDGKSIQIRDLKDRIATLEDRNIEHEMRFESEEAKSEHWRTEYLNAASDAQQFATRIAALEAQLAERVPLDPDMPAQQLRMHLGEMTAQELRTARAAIRLANSALSALEATPRLPTKEEAPWKYDVPPRLAAPPAPKVTEVEAALVIIQEKYDLRRSTLLSAITAALSGDAS